MFKNKGLTNYHWLWAVAGTSLLTHSWTSNHVLKFSSYSSDQHHFLKTPLCHFWTRQRWRLHNTVECTKYHSTVHLKLLLHDYYVNVMLCDFYLNENTTIFSVLINNSFDLIRLPPSTRDEIVLKICCQGSHEDVHLAIPFVWNNSKYTWNFLHY